MQQQVLEVNHFHHHPDVLLRRRAQVVLEVAFPLQLEHHLLDGWTLPAYAAESVPQSMGLTLQGIFDERLALRGEGAGEGERGGRDQSLLHTLTF